jgi:IstB-like ATP binding protein
MPGPRLPMRKIHDVLRLSAAGMSKRKIAASLGVSATAAGDCIRRARRAGLGWPLGEALTEEALECRLYPPSSGAARDRRPQPDWAAVHRELRRAGVTLQLLWEEHRAAHPDGYRTPRRLDKALFQQLATCRWIAEHRGLLVTGPCGVGKSWLSCALAQKACRDGYTVHYARVPRLFADLDLAHGDGRFARLFRMLVKVDLLVLDDWAPIASRPASDAILWRSPRIATAAAPRCSPASSPWPVGTKLLASRLSAMPSWIGLSTTPTGSSSTARRCARSKLASRPGRRHHLRPRTQPMASRFPLRAPATALPFAIASNAKSGITNRAGEIAANSFALKETAHGRNIG